MSRSNLQRAVPPAIVAAAVAMAIATTAAAAGDQTVDELEEITVTATRAAARVDEVPATVSVISAARMERQLVQTIEDLVRYEPGVTVTTAPARFTAALATTGRDGQSGFNIRGLEGNRVLIQVDGVRTPDAYSFGAQSVGRGEYVDLGLLKSVEIVRGPASALYGSDGLAGAVSFITRDPAELLQPGRDFTARLHSSWTGVSDTLAHSLIGAGRVGEWEALAAYTRRDGEAHKTGGDNDAANVTRTTANPEDNRSNSLLVKLVRDLGEQHRLRLTWDHRDSRTDWNVLTAIALPPLAATSVLGLTAFDTLGRNRYALDHRYSGAGWLDSLTTTLSWQSSSTRQYSAEDRNTAADRVRDATFDTLVRGLSIEGHSSIDGGALQQRLVFGVDASRTSQRSLRDGVVPPAGETFPSHAFPNTVYTLVGVFVQDELRWERFSLYPALRWDHFKLDPKDDPLFTVAVPAELTDSHLSPKLGAVLRFEESWSAFANLAAGFKAPAPAQVNSGFSNPAFGYESVSNPDLKPETSRTVEIGLRRSGPRWSATVTGFTGEYDDFISQEFIGGAGVPGDLAQYQYINLPGVKISGVEFKSELRLFEGLSWTLVSAWSKGSSDDGAVREPLYSINPLRVVSGLDWNAPGLPVGGQLVATFARRKEASRVDGSCMGCLRPGGYGVVDVIGWWEPARNITVRGGVFNLLDKHYANWSDVRGVQQTTATRDAWFNPGRNLSASVTVQF